MRHRERRLQEDDTAQEHCTQTHCCQSETDEADRHTAERGGQGHGKRSVRIYA